MIAAAFFYELANRRVVEDDDANVSADSMAVTAGRRPGRSKDHIPMRVHDPGAETMPPISAVTLGF